MGSVGEAVGPSQTPFLFHANEGVVVIFIGLDAFVHAGVAEVGEVGAAGFGHAFDSEVEDLV